MANWALQLVTAPTAEPIATAQAKTHAGVDISDHDALIAALVTAAREYWESAQGRALVLQTWDLAMDAWPKVDYIRLPRAPLRSVVSITYVDSDGTSNTLAATEYVVDLKSEPGRVVLGYGKSWPSKTLRPGGAITVRYRAGYAIPFTVAISTEIITAVGHPFANGDAVRVWNTGGALPTGLSALTDYYVISVSGDTFKLSATSGGSAIDITAAGTGTHFVGLIPQQMLQGLLLLVGHWYEHTEAVVITPGEGPREVPFAADALMRVNQTFYSGPGE